MTESRRPYGATQPEPIDDNEDRMGSVRELDLKVGSEVIAFVKSTEVSIAKL